MSKRIVDLKQGMKMSEENCVSEVLMPYIAILVQDDSMRNFTLQTVGHT